MVHGSKDGLLIDGDAGILLGYVRDGIGDCCRSGNRHFNSVGIGNNAVHPKKLDCDIQFFSHDIIRRI